MKLTNSVPKYEAITGTKVPPEVIRFAQQMDIASQRFEVKGCEDAVQGLPVPPEDTFHAWGKKIFDDDPAMAEAMGNLAQLYYMSGYQKGGAADGV